ncbi:MAG: glycosyltransferase family 4 protein [Desulfocucumaceae bacterium]
MVIRKVLLVVTLSEIGGAQKVVYNLAAGLKPEQFEVTVACGPGGELIGWLKGLPGVKVVELDCLKRNISPLGDTLCLFRLYRLIKSGGYDIVHCHSSKAGILGRLAARMAGVKQIYFTVHGWGIDENQQLLVRWLYTVAERVAGAVSARVVCVSRYDLEKGIRLGLVAKEKLDLIYNGMPDEYAGPENNLYRPDVRNRLKKELGLPSDGIVVATVMRLADPKNPLFFLETAERLIKENNDKNIFFVIIGDGPLWAQCEEYIYRNSLGGRVFMMGKREDVSLLLSGLDVFTLFSHHEGLPLTVIEAMLAGLPVVASNVGGIKEMVDHGGTGYLVDGFDPGISAEYIKELAGNHALRAKMGEAGRGRALELYGLERMIGEYEKLYRS